MKLFSTLAVTLICTASLAQNYTKEIADSIVAEGKKLYRSEMASWYGTDIALEKLKDERRDIGGYFSYPEGDSTTCVFYSKGSDPHVMATIRFDNSFNPAKASYNDEKRSFTNSERDLFLIRKAALEVVNSDSLF